MWGLHLKQWARLASVLAGLEVSLTWVQGRRATKSPPSRLVGHGIRAVPGTVSEGLHLLQPSLYWCICTTLISKLSIFFWGRARTGITLHGRSIAKETNKVFPTWDRFWASTRVLWKRSWAWSTLTHGNNLHKPCPDFQQKYELCWELSSDIIL